MSTSDALLPFARKFFEADPAQGARLLNTYAPARAGVVLKALPPATAVEVLGHLSPAYSAEVIQSMSPRDLSVFVERCDPQRIAAILPHLSSEQRTSFLENALPSLRDRIREILSFPDDSAGRIMRHDFLALPSDLRVRDTILQLRQMVKRKAPVSYLYVVDRDHRLVGILNMRDLLLSASESVLQDVMRPEVFSVDPFMEKERVAQLLSDRRFFSVPVLDADRRLLGVVKAEDLITEAAQEATEDFQKMFGAGGDERAFSPVLFTVKKRLPWLHINLLTAFLAAGVVALFENMIAKMTFLAIFLPVVAGQGGNAGGQTLAVVMRALVMREIPTGKAKKLILKEVAVGAINGLVIGIVTGLVAWGWLGNAMFGVVVALGMLANLVAAGLSGAAIPLLMKSIGLDPAQSSNIILTTVTDVVGFFAFLGLAFLFQARLISG
jgi:magnesium transporter